MLIFLMGNYKKYILMTLMDDKCKNSPNQRTHLPKKLLLGEICVELIRFLCFFVILGFDFGLKKFGFKKGFGFKIFLQFKEI